MLKQSLAPIASILALLPCAGRAQDSFSLRDLDHTQALLSGYAFAINANGIAIGGGSNSSTTYFDAVRFDGAGATLLPALPGDDAATAFGINRAGTIVGTSTDVTQAHQLLLLSDHPVMWKNGQAIDIRTLVTTSTSLELRTAISINDHEDIVGLARDPATETVRAYRLSNGVVTDLGGLPGSPFPGSSPAHIANDGTIVGSAASVGGFNHAVVWQGGTIVDLHAQASIPGRVSHAQDVNRFGVIVGSADYGADFLDYETATIWVNGQATNLGTLAGPSAPPVIESFARGINDLGQVVGVSITANYEAHAFLYRDGTMLDLNSLVAPGSGWLLTNAHDIDNAGRIVGEGFHGNTVRPFVLIPQCDGTYAIYGTACPVASGPRLSGAGCPEGNYDFGLEIADGSPGIQGLLFLGAGAGSAPIGFGCALQTLPLYPVQFPVTLDGSGSDFVPAKLPIGTPPFDLWLEAIFLDAAQPYGLATTQGLKLHYVP